MCLESSDEIVPHGERLGCGFCDVNRIGQGVLVVCKVDAGSVSYYSDQNEGMVRQTTGVVIPK